MGTVTALEAKTRFGELLDRVSKGEEIVITRHDKPVARMVPESKPSADELRATVAGIRAFRDRLSKRKGFKPITDKEILSAIREGRK